jgi:1-acyl-sn-glycerol-3-phosphate acyltransferase
MIYKILHIMLKFSLHLFFRLRSSGLENVPPGGCIIASNHISLLDPPVIGCSLPRTRKINFMAKEELFKIPLFNSVITQMGAFPVKRGMPDRNAIRYAVSVLQSGEVLGMFPEGTRSKTGQLGEPLPGMAMIAVKAGVPVVPAAVFGTNTLWGHGHFFPPILVKFGRPIYLASGRTAKESGEILTKTVMEEISRLMNEGGR